MTKEGLTEVMGEEGVMAVEGLVELGCGETRGTWLWRD